MENTTNNDPSRLIDETPPRIEDRRMVMWVSEEGFKLFHELVVQATLEEE
jgi:hypothetical protein